jgi:hypothetical protein
MTDMAVVFTVTDKLGIDRELVSVPLEKEDPGGVQILSSGEIEIVVPLTIPLEQWAVTLGNELRNLGVGKD